MKINTKEMVTWIGIVLLFPILIYPLMSSNVVLLLSEALSCGIGIIFLLSKSQLLCRKHSIFLLWLLTIIPIVVNSYSLKMHQYGFTLLWLTCLLYFFVIEQHRKLDFHSVIFFIGVTCCIYVVSTILFNFNIISSFLLQLARLFRTTIFKGDLKTAGFTSHYSHNSMYIALAVIVWYAYAINKREKKYYLLLILSIAAMLFTKKRGPLVALVIAILLTSLVKNHGTLVKKLQRIIIVVTVVFSGAYIASLIFPSLFSVLDRFSSSDNFLSSRDHLWEYAIKMFNEKPLFGHGWGSYAGSVDLVVDTVDVSSIYAHNIYFQLLAEVGIVGFLLFLIPMLKTLLITFKINKTPIEQDGVEMTFSLCMQLFFFIYGLSGNTLYDKQMLLPYMIAVAITLFYQGYSAEHSENSFENTAIIGNE